jgi:hypothetical protein
MDGTTDQIAEQMKTFGGESARVEVDSLREAVRRLSKLKIAGVDTVSNAMLRVSSKTGRHRGDYRVRYSNRSWTCA